MTAYVLTVLTDVPPDTRFGIAGHEGVQPVDDTESKTNRHLIVFQHECHLQVRALRAGRLGAW